MMPDNPIDVGIAIFIIMFCIFGFVKGVVRQFFSILAFIIASVASVAIPLFVNLPGIGSVSPIWGHLIFSVLIWLPAFLILNGIGKFIAKRISKKGIKFTDRIWGLVFGGIKGLIIIVLIIFLLDILPAGNDILIESKIVSTIQPYNPLLKMQIMQNLQMIISAISDPDYMDLLNKDAEFRKLKDNEIISLILDDPELKKALNERQFIKFITHPKIQMLIKDKEAMRLLLTMDVDKVIISTI